LARRSAEAVLTRRRTSGTAGGGATRPGGHDAPPRDSARWAALVSALMIALSRFTACRWWNYCVVGWSCDSPITRRPPVRQPRRESASARTKRAGPWQTRHARELRVGQRLAKRDVLRPALR